MNPIDPNNEPLETSHVESMLQSWVGDAPGLEKGDKALSVAIHQIWANESMQIAIILSLGPVLLLVTD